MVMLSEGAHNFCLTLSRAACWITFSAENMEPVKAPYSRVCLCVCVWGGGGVGEGVGIGNRKLFFLISP